MLEKYGNYLSWLRGKRVGLERKGGEEGGGGKWGGGKVRRGVGGGM